MAAVLRSAVAWPLQLVWPLGRDQVWLSDPDRVWLWGPGRVSRSDPDQALRLDLDLAWQLAPVFQMAERSPWEAVRVKAQAWPSGTGRALAQG